MAIARYARATVGFREDAFVKIESRDLGFSCVFDEEGEVVARKRWKRQATPLYIVANRIRRIAGSKRGLDVRVESEIPIGVGLGSSAAVAVAVAAASSTLLGLDLRRDEISRIAYESEVFVHGKPSGIDNTVSTHGGIIFFERGQITRRLEVPRRIPIVVGNTGAERSTGMLVRSVRKLVERHPEVAHSIISTIGELSRQVSAFMERGDLRKIGELMNINHELLAALGVSTEALDQLVHRARRVGALGAKLTGAGGGGCVIALAEGKVAENVIEAWRSAGVQAFQAQVDEAGMRSWLL